MAKNNNLTDLLTDVADAIRAKKSTTDLINPQDFSSEIASISTGRPENSYEVTFVDVDGTILKTEYVIKGDSATPPNNPTREHCTFIKWIGSYTNVEHNCIIGASYRSSDGNEYYKVKVPAGTLFQLYTAANTTTDWGDGSSTTTSTGVSASHTYTSDFEGWITVPVSSSADSTNSKACVLEKILSSSITTLTSKAVSYMENCQALIIPDSVVSIDEKVFTNVYTKYVILPDSVTTIGNSAFQDSQVQYVILPDSVTTIGNKLFYSSDVKYVVIPSSVTSIGYQLFYYCRTVQTIIYQNSVTGSTPFGQCFDLINLTLPPNCTSVPSLSLSYALRVLVIPATVTKLASNMLSNTCLRSIIILATTPPTITTGTSGSLENSLMKRYSIYVPDDVVETYKVATNWENYASYIYPLSTCKESY